ncbi:alpha-mannosyltransferase [Grosmannia clavigera kw1407]|uniref:Alpha-1,3/1,6-mannosyltransferase ALG2 n=1 Tax=Grosmannia clavigera (strain kw1407 / UAMH 11150) TaxID=655863 RepID=F0X6Z5_GROCL|nr:alpha-mannosyltransferase [Grosmannia clavigera kw1407]EFX06253.1 alpha-mannosyltransferase [Grosmannia clavigera kw1407]
MAETTTTTTRTTTRTTAEKPRTVVFLHPDLGIGGAERLVVDAAVGLQKRGHRVVIFTSHCDPAHCFDEVRPGSGTLDVRVRGGSVVPPTVLGRLAIVCAIARQTHLLVQIWASGELAALRPTALFVDQLSAGLPLLRWRWWKRLYRMPFDALEQWSMGFADAVAVNSRFTRGVVAETWPQLAAHTDLQVVYPCIEVGEDKEERDKDEPVLPWGGMPFLLSINRFERKKDVGLAVRAFAGLPAGRRAGSRLVVAGGYDPRVAENVEYHRELDRLATDLGLRTATAKTMVSALGVPADVDVLFLLSVPSALKTVLLQAARLLVYTPAREHFGIVPLEAMLAGLPVLACDTGGPTETVVEDETGWLRPPADVAAWTTIMSRALPGAVDSIPDPQRARMAAAGRRRVRSQFAGAQMAARIDGIYDELDAAAGSGTKKNHRPPLPTGLLVVLAGLLGLVIALAVGLVRWAV